MSPNMMRQLWALVESSQSQLLLELDDVNLVDWLMQQIERQSGVNIPSTPKESRVMRNYIQEHLLLIRDIADTHKFGDDQSMASWA